MSTHPPPSAANIAEACRLIDPLFLDTPLTAQATADRELGLRLFAKVETLNPIRSFKGRGADYWMSGQPASDEPVVSASAGNFGQGLAYAAAKRGRRAVIFAATTANRRKVDAMIRLGAEVVLEGEDFDAAKLRARAFARERGLTFVEDGGHPAIAEGAGTIAKEAVEALAARAVMPDILIAPLGNGALLTGMGAWLRAALPSCRVVGVVAAGAPSMKLSWERDRPEATAGVSTAADGIAIREPVPYALDCMRPLVDEVLAAGEPAIEAATAFCRRHYGLVVEPAGAAGIAGLLQNPGMFAGRTVVTVLCGGNVADGGPVYVPQKVRYTPPPGGGGSA